MAKRRGELGWTQARLAERVALSRVALSHIEGGMSVPSERTVTLLAGVFGCEPHELAEGTNYPTAKMERLPLVTARHTEAAHLLAVLDAVLAAAARVPPPAGDRLDAAVRDEWRPRLRDLLDRCADPAERRRVRAVLTTL